MERHVKHRANGLEKENGHAGPAAAIVTAAGGSTRMGGVRKTLALVDGVPVLKKAVDAFIACGKIDRIVITYRPGEEDLRAVFGPGDTGLIWVAGGETRQESVYLALLSLEEYAPEYVLIHDAARPWVTTELIASVLEGAIRHGACIPVVAHVNAPKQIDEKGGIIAHLDRGVVVGAQTPQGFRYREIVSAHRAARQRGRVYPDDSEVYHDAIGCVYTVPGDPANRKITYRHDV